MYIVTFYSFKGGVGRTMALANVAYMLAEAGKRVLVVDFDLEAPGLSKYEGLRSSDGSQGLVEYVSGYARTRAAPDASEFIQPCTVGEQTIWVMGAGDHHSPGYARLLNGINWGKLYNEQQGFLFMEDLKQQWSTYQGLGFDYVLLDSRTGHTDVGGICTRQLPDSVVVMFVPTSQNIDGLQPIVEAIRVEGEPVRSNKVLMHFCPSNVPDLDDQESILSELLEQAKHALGYAAPASVIQHYASLDLLQQPIYAFSSPKTKLVRQYRDLFTAIVSGNLEDEDGALLAAKQLPDRYAEARRNEDRVELSSIKTTISRIRALHSKNAEISWALAALANKMGEPEAEVEALSSIVAQGKVTPRVLLHRALALASINSDDRAIDDLVTLFERGNLSVFDAVPAANLLLRLLPNGWRPIFWKALEDRRLDPSATTYIAYWLLTDREGASFAAEVTSQLELGSDDLAERTSRAGHALALLSSKQFDAARRFLFEDTSSALISESIYDVFNYAVADWAGSGVPNEALFKRAVDLRASLKGEADANLYQCMALAFMVCSDWPAAGEELDRALQTPKNNFTFSCWSYLLLEEAAFNEDLAAMMARVERRELGSLPFA